MATITSRSLSFPAGSRTFSVALVGYTNAGKSTLLNTLTQSEVIAEDKLFATLDPTARSLRLPDGGKILLTDTVGFLDDLPSELVMSFTATLEEMEGAGLLVHLADASHSRVAMQIDSVRQIVRRILQRVELIHRSTPSRARTG